VFKGLNVIAANGPLGQWAVRRLEVKCC